MLPDAIFLDEAIANLDAMDAALADVDAAADPDIVHAVFRHAHSIKGGAAAFGLRAVAELMHSIESVLDVSRTSGVAPDVATARLLRDAIDAARRLLSDDGAVDNPVVQDVAMRLRRQSLAPRVQPAGTLRFITVRSDEMEVVSAAIVSLFTDIAGLGELLSVDGGADGERRFMVRSLARDQELLDLLAMHVERGNVSIAAVPALTQATRGTASAGVGAGGKHGAMVRVDAAELRRLASLARRLMHDGAAFGATRDGIDGSRWQQDLGDLCKGLQALGCTPVASLFGRIPPLLQRLEGQLNKRFELSMSGDGMWIDRAVLQCLADPLFHLVRNACDHGIEMAEQRKVAGKPLAGQIAVSAWREPGRLQISVGDDGAGLSRDTVLRAAKARAIPLPDELDDHAVWQLVFVPGLSTARSVSLVSGRGVGMDAVRRQVSSMGGDVSITSTAGHGVCVTMSIPVDDEWDITTVL